LIATVKAAVDQVEQDNSTISIKLLKYLKKIDSLKEVKKYVFFSSITNYLNYFGREEKWLSLIWCQVGPIF